MPEPDYIPPDLTLYGEEHIRRYRETDGEVGYIWNGVPTLLLTARGRKTGEARTQALIFGRDGDDYVVIASVGGMPAHPAWYLNVVAEPRASIQVKGEHLEVEARTASDEEKSRLWQMMAEQWPNYDTYQARTTREIPVVLLRPLGTGK